MAISSNTLFHFFGEYNYLKQSIEEGLWPRYCIEKKWKGKDLAIPMFCFCDIPLSQIKDHIDEKNGYGCYGIGVTKEFAMDNKITPVTYLSQESFLMNKILNFLTTFNSPSVNHKEMDFREMMLYYLKKVSGFNNEEERSRKFYNEREWRYIPEITQDVHLEILSGNYNKDKVIRCLSTKTEKCKLALKPKNIVYIIVKNESEINDMIDVLKNSFGTDKNLPKLYTRIITVKQIIEDF